MMLYFGHTTIFLQLINGEVWRNILNASFSFGVVDNEIISQKIIPELSFPTSKAYQTIGVLIPQNRPCHSENIGIWNWLHFFTFHLICLKFFFPKNYLFLANIRIRHISFNLCCRVTCFLNQITISQYCDLLSLSFFFPSIQKRCRNSSVWSKKQHHLSGMHT